MTAWRADAPGTSTDPSPPPMLPWRPGDVAPGRIVAGRYEIVERLGSGGMGTVWRARDLDLQEDIALKVLHQDLRQGRIDLGDLQREVRLARRIAHRNVCRTFDAGQDGELRFITMELAAGEPLRALLRRGPLPAARAFDLLGQLTEGVGAAHAQGIIHRDLKPDNVLVGGDGRVVILDFGLASSVAQEPTCSRMFAGTPAYMSPEQHRGMPLDARTDVFSVGIIAFEIFVGRHPFGDGPPATITTAILRDPPSTLDAPGLRPEVAAALGEVLARAMAKRPADRYRGMTDLREALAGARQGTRRAPRSVTWARRASARLFALLLATPMLSGWHIAPPVPAPSPAASAPLVAEAVALALEEARIHKRNRDRQLEAELGTASDAARSLLLQYYEVIGPAPRPETLDAGRPLLDQALAEDPHYAPALLDKAELLSIERAAGRGLSTLAEGLGLIEQALSLDRGAPRAWILRCDHMQRVLLGDGEPTDEGIAAAFDACHAAQREASWSGEVQMSLARLYDLRCDDEWAMNALKAALELDPSLEGRIVEHQLDLALQAGNLPLADRLSARLVDVYEEDRENGTRSLRRWAGAPAPRAAYLLRAGVLMRHGRLDEARAALERELAEIAGGPGDPWSKASAIRGLLRIAEMQGAPEDEALRAMRREVEMLERKHRSDVAAGAADPLLLPCAYRSTDPAEGAAWLKQSPPPATFRRALAHAILYHMAGDDAAARRVLRAVKPRAQWEHACATRLGWVLSH